MKYDNFSHEIQNVCGNEIQTSILTNHMRQKQGNSSVAMGIWWSADVGQVDGFCDEKFKDVERLFANQRLAQLCVFVDGKMVVGILNLKFDL